MSERLNKTPDTIKSKDIVKLDEVREERKIEAIKKELPEDLVIRLKGSPLHVWEKFLEQNQNSEELWKKIKSNPNRWGSNTPTEEGK